MIMNSEEKRREFLQHLPPGTREYQYSHFSALEEVVMQEYTLFITNHDGQKGPFVVFKNIPPSEIEAHQEGFPGRIDYDSCLQTLILTMSSLPHETAAERFNTILTDSVRAMGVEHETGFRGASTVKGPDREKQADRSWSARPRTGRGTDWPTVVLEVGFSECREKLEQDARWWLSGSAEVRRVVTLDIKRPSGNIYITEWERGANVGQRIQIYRGQDGQGPRVVGEDPRIPFHQLLGRAPNADRGERDVVIKKDGLVDDVADRVWEEMDESALQQQR